MVELLGLGHFGEDVSFWWGRAQCVSKEWFPSVRQEQLHLQGETEGSGFLLKWRGIKARE